MLRHVLWEQEKFRCGYPLQGIESASAGAVYECFRVLFASIDIDWEEVCRVNFELFLQF